MVLDTLPATAAGGSISDNESLNIVLTKAVESHVVDLAVDQEGLHVVIARGSIS